MTRNYYHQKHFDSRQRKLVESDNKTTEGERIVRIVDLAERRLALRKAKDRKGLLALAKEYQHFGTFGMKRTADAIRREAARMA